MSVPPRPLISRRLRFVLSLLICGHLLAVFMPPMAFQSRGPRGLSPSVAAMLRPFSGYAQFLYLDRGYAFFAPNPGPSHLLRVEIEAENQTPEVRIYPDLEQQWPRLLYHRHFMLAEFLNDAYQPKLPVEAASLVGPELSIEELQAWRLGRQRYEKITDSMKNRLKSEFGNREIKIDRLEHLLPDFVAYAADPTPLNDPATYLVIEDIPITLETLLGGQLQALPGPGERESVPVPTGEPAQGNDPAEQNDSSLQESSQ